VKEHWSNYGGYKNMKEQKMINQMIERPSWLWPRDFQFVKSVAQQLEEGRRKKLSAKQAKVIKDIHGRWKKNQGPRFLPGGLPGHGKRR
jgi:phage terminase small subunit